MSRRHRLSPDMPGQQTPCPQFSGVAEFLSVWNKPDGLPSPCLLGDYRSVRAMIRILERSLSAHGERLFDPLPDALTGKSPSTAQFP